MIRTIFYTPKVTAARTEYRALNDEDLAWLKTELIKYLANMSERDLNPSEDNQWILNRFWHRRTDKLHKGRVEDTYRQNTPCSFVGGMVNNLVFGTQKDITAKQMEDLEFISQAMATITDSPAIRFQIRIF